MRPLLDEEAATWESELLWDFTDVRSAVAGGIDRGAMPGQVVIVGGRAVAYCYYMAEAGRAIVGSIFAGREFRDRGMEEELVDAVVADARCTRGATRIECQTLFTSAQRVDERFVRAGFTHRGRHYMVRDLAQPPLGVTSRLPPGFAARPLRREDLHQAADVVYRSHVASVDAALNLTYATPSTCRGFVDTLVLRAGCGRFDASASLLLEGPKGPAGVLIASRLARSNGHICQVSVVPEAQGRGLGTALVLTALEAFRAQGLATATLSVTVDNTRAHRLYVSLGFRVRKEFSAHAWLRPPARIELPE